MDIAKTVIKAYEKFDTLPRSVDDVFALDEEVRDFVKKF